MRNKIEHLCKAVAIALFMFVMYSFFMGYAKWIHDSLWYDYWWHTNAADLLTDSLSVIKETGVRYLPKRMGDYKAILVYPMWHLLEQAALFTQGGIVDEYSHVKATAITNTLVLATALMSWIVCLKKEKTTLKALDYLLCASAFFVGTLYLPWLGDRYYLGGFLPNTWHNPTVMMVKPFTILLFYLYYQILTTDAPKNYYQAASLVMAISAFAKPALYQILMPTLAIYCVITFLTRRDKYSLMKGCKVALTCLPTLVVAIAQVLILAGEHDTSFKIEYMAGWKGIVDNIGMSVFITVLFPALGALLALVYKINVKKYVFSLLLLLVAMGELAFVYMPNKLHDGDFAWAVILAVFINYLVAVETMIKTNRTRKAGVNLLLRVVTYAFYVVQLAEGIWYMSSILQTGQYLQKLQF